MAYEDNDYSSLGMEGFNETPQLDPTGEIDASMWNVLRATRAYKKHLSKGRALDQEEMQELKWSMDVLSKHADDYQPLTSNLKDMVQALSVLPGDIIDAATGVFRGKFFEDTVPFASSAATGALAWKYSAPAMSGILKGLSYIPGPVGIAFKGLQASKGLYGGIKLAAQAAGSTYAALTTNDILKGNYDAEHLRVAGVEAADRTIGEIMKANLKNLPRNTVAAMGIMHSFGYIANKAVARSKYNSIINEEKVRKANAETMKKAQEGQEAASKAYGGGEEEASTVGTAEEAAKKAARTVEEGAGVVEEALTPEEIAERRILQEEEQARAYEPTAEEARVYEEAGPNEPVQPEPEAMAGEQAEGAVPPTGPTTPPPPPGQAAAGPTTPPPAQPAGPTTPPPATGQQAGPTTPPPAQPAAGQQAAGQAAGATTPPLRQQPTSAQRFYGKVKNAIKNLKDRKKVTLSDLLDTFEVKIDPKTGEMSFNKNSPVNSEERLGLLLELVHKDKLDGLNPAEKHRYIFGLFHGINNTGAALRMRFTNNGLFGNLTREGVTNHVKEFQALHRDPKAVVEMMNYYLGKKHNVSAMGKVFADNMARTYKEIRHEFAKRGVIIPELEYNYAPQRASAHKIVKHGRETFIRDLTDWVDLAKMGLDKATPEALNKVMNTIYDTFRTKDSFSDLSFSAEGESALGGMRSRRIIHFKDGATHEAYMKKYGAVENSIEAVMTNVQSLANLLALVEHFGPNPQKVATALMDHVGNLYEGQAAGKAPPRRPKIFQYLKIRGKELGDLAVQRANKNLYNAIFYKGEMSLENLSINWLSNALRIYNGVEAIGKNTITANNATWEVVETPLATSFLQESYKAGTTPRNVVEAYKRSVQGLAAHLGEGLTKKQALALQEIGVRYGIQNDLMPYKLSVGTPYDMPIGMRKFNHWISKIKTTDSLTQANQITAATMFQNMLGNHIAQVTSWKNLPARVRGLLESGGINAKDWATLLASDVLVHDSLFADLPIEVNSNLLSPMYMLNRNKGNVALSVIAEKLIALQHNHVQRAVSSAQFESTAALLGEHAVSRNMGSHLVRNAVVFRGYQFDRIARWIAMLDYEGHNYTNSRFVSYAWQRMAIGLTTGLLRWGLAGRVPQLDSAQDFMDLLMDGAARGDLMPFAIGKEFFADFYHTQGNSIIDTLQDKAGSSALGVGAHSMLKHAYNFTNGAEKMLEGDYTRAFAKMRRALPGSNFLPIDVLYNRLLLDNIFSSIDDDGFYQLTKKEMATNAKNTYKYYIEPGRFTKTKGGEISGATGSDALRTSAEGEFREERAAFREEEYQKELEGGASKEIAKKRAKIKAAKFQPSNPLYQERKKTNRAINAINKQRMQSDDPAVWDSLQAKADKIQAKYDLKVAEYYMKNRPATVTPLQAKNAYKRAKRLAEE